MTTPSVSCIIIFLNGEQFLAEAIESVLAQTFTDWELLLCDDGSATVATTIAKNYAARFPDRIRYLEHDGHVNKGMSATRTLGIRNARGRYIAMLDADDVWTPSKLAEQFAILEATPQAAMVYGPMTVWFGWTGRAEDQAKDFIQDLGVPTDTLVEPPAIVVAFLKDVMHHANGALIRRDVLDAVGGYEERFRAEFEDVVLQSKICLQYPVYASGTSWQKYRQHDASCCAAKQRRGRERATRLVFLRWLERYMISKSMQSSPAWNALQEQLDSYRPLARFYVSEAARRAARPLLPVKARSWLKSKYLAVRAARGD
jgi:glycosyltransferase involved in cell wall biosynthesis